MLESVFIYRVLLPQNDKSVISRRYLRVGDIAKYKFYDYILPENSD